LASLFVSSSVFVLLQWRHSDHGEVQNIDCRLQSNGDTNKLHVAVDDSFALRMKLIYELGVCVCVQNTVKLVSVVVYVCL